MSFITDLVDFIEAQTSLTIDTDLFIGTDQLDGGSRRVVISESPGGVESESGLITHPIQVLAKDLTYLSAQGLAMEVYDVLANKPGFSTFSDIFYVEVINMPYPVSRDSRGMYIFSTNFLFRRV